MNAPNKTADAPGLTTDLSSAADAAHALEQHLLKLLAYADLFAASRHSVASREMRRSLMHAITVLRVLQDELTCIGLVASLSGLKGAAC
jgi:hypothetical protein